MHRRGLLGGLSEDDRSGGLHARFERRGLFLDANEPLASRAAAVEGTADIRAERRVLAAYDTPRTVADTDEGARIRERIALLRTLL